MELAESVWDDVFPRHSPFSCPLLNDVLGPDGFTPSLNYMLVDTELAEILLAPEQAASHPNPASTPLSLPHPVTTPQSQSLETIPSVSAVIQTLAVIAKPLAGNTKTVSVSAGTSEFVTVAAPWSPPMSSAPNTPRVGKPKRSRGRGGQSKPNSCPRTKKQKSSAGLDDLEPKLKENRQRMPTQAEHIIRERQRRDDMSAKYSVLESLLPLAPKRERAVVVVDAISLLRALQQKRDELLSRRADLVLMASCHRNPWRIITRSRTSPAVLDPGGAPGNPSQCIVTNPRSAPRAYCKSDSSLSASSDGGLMLADFPNVTSSPCSAAGSITTINVNIAEEEIVLEMVWNKPPRNFQSALLQAVQSLGFDVTQCSILRVLNGCTQCVVTCSTSEALSLRISEIQSSATLITRALRNILTRS